MKPSLSLGKRVDFYLRSRRRLGFALKTEEKRLKSLVVYAQKVRHRGPLTEKLALEWARLPADANPMWWAKRLVVVRGLARFWHAFDPKVQVPPPGVFGPSNCRRAVHIYTAREIALLLAEAGRLCPDFRAATVKTLLALLACTGLRIAEALKLQIDDFDRAAATLMIRRSKFGQSRIVPLKSSSVRALAAYQAVCQKYRVPSSSTTFFLSAKGAAIPYETVRTTFGRLRKRLGWLRPTIPRIHDLRHTFAVNRLMAWQRQQTDVLDRKILALGTYLGHRNIGHTYWYLSATPELLALASKRLPVCPAKEAANE